MEIPRDASVSMERSLLQEDITPVQLQLSARSKDDSFSDRSSSRYNICSKTLINKSETLPVLLMPLFQEFVKAHIKWLFLPCCKKAVCEGWYIQRSENYLFFIICSLMWINLFSVEGREADRGDLSRRKCWPRPRSPPCRTHSPG